nr:hypothetical protein [Mycobacterium uberis]
MNARRAGWTQETNWDNMSLGRPVGNWAHKEYLDALGANQLDSQLDLLDEHFQDVSEQLYDLRKQCPIFCPPWSGVVWFCFMWGVVVWVVVWVDGLCELIYCVDVLVAVSPSVKRVVL